MERDNSQNRKRTRDGEDENTEKQSHGGKKQECVSRGKKNTVYNDQKRYEFYDGIGVFDFPWLKEGVMFKGEDFLDEHDENFPPCSYLDEAPGTLAANLDQSCLQNLCVSPALPDGNLHDNEFDDDRSFWSLLVDDLEPVDCIWSCVVDQPLDIAFKNL